MQRRLGGELLLVVRVVYMQIHTRRAGCMHMISTHTRAHLHAQTCTHTHAQLFHMINSGASCAFFHTHACTHARSHARMHAPMQVRVFLDEPAGGAGRWCVSSRERVLDRRQEAKEEGSTFFFAADGARAHDRSYRGSGPSLSITHDHATMVRGAWPTGLARCTTPGSTAPSRSTAASGRRGSCSSTSRGSGCRRAASTSTQSE